MDLPRGARSCFARDLSRSIGKFKATFTRYVLRITKARVVSSGFIKRVPGLHAKDKYIFVHIHGTMRTVLPLTLTPGLIVLNP